MSLGFSPTVPAQGLSWTKSFVFVLIELTVISGSDSISCVTLGLPWTASLFRATSVMLKEALLTLE